MPSSGEDGIVVFAYGSNMLTRRFRGRCPSAHALGIAELHGYELRWNKRSRDGSGKCTITWVEVEGGSVHGVLYEIAASEKPDLDRAEGRGFGYEEGTVEVQINGSNRLAFAFVGTDIDPFLKPYTWYKSMVVAGAKEHGLPEHHVMRLKSAEAIEDPDRERHRLNMELLHRAGDA